MNSFQARRHTLITLRGTGWEIPSGPRRGARAARTPGRRRAIDQQSAGSPDATVARVSLHLIRGEHRDAAGLSELALRSMRDDRVRASRLLVMLTEAQLGVPDVGAAESSVTRLEQLAASPTLSVVAARAALARGVLAQQRGQTDAARRAYELGVLALADTDWPLLVAAQLRLGQVLADTDAPAAIAVARAAHLTWERLGSPRSACSASLLNRLGLRATSKPNATDPRAMLSPRERTVLAHLRDGRSNAEIAGRLNNSVRTIEHHVSSILAKLGLRSRAEAAVYAATIETAEPLVPTPSCCSARWRCAGALGGPSRPLKWLGVAVTAGRKRRQEPVARGAVRGLEYARIIARCRPARASSDVRPT